MATIVNLNLGGEGDGTPETPSYELILQNGYTEPSPYLLVLRSAEAHEALLNVTEAGDSAFIEGVVTEVAEGRIATIAVSGKADTASVSLTVDPPDAELTISATEDRDTPAVSAEFNIEDRVASIAATEDRDTPAVSIDYTDYWFAEIAATDGGDVPALNAAFSPYTGPGFVEVTERRDSAQVSVRHVYDVAATIDFMESGDTASVIVTTAAELEVSASDTLVFTDTLTGTVVESGLRDTLVFSDQIQDSGQTAFSETLTFSDSLGGNVALVGALHDTGVLTDALGGALVGALADTVVFTDTLRATGHQEISDALGFTDTLGGLLETSGVLSDVLTLTDTLDSTYFEALSDTLNFTDSLSGNTEVVAGLSDALVFTDALDGATTVIGSLTDTLVFTDALAGGLELVGVLSDTLVFTDWWVQATQIIHVVNAETGAVSTYTLTPKITGLAQFKGVLYLAGPTGLYAVDAEQDEDGAVVWTLRTGFSNLGADRLKRVQDANFQARTEGDTTFQVVSDRYGQKQEWNYRLPPLTRDSYRDGVVKPGKGIQSVYWQFAAQGIGPAEIDQVRLVVEPLSRRR